MSDRRPRVVIVGAGFGGLEAAKRLAHRDVDVTVVDRRNHHLFQPLLYQVATAALSPADIAAPIRSILARAPNVRVLLDGVCGVIPGANHVCLESGRRFLVGFRSRLSVTLNWAWNYFTFARSARLITGPVSSTPARSWAEAA